MCGRRFTLVLLGFAAPPPEDPPVVPDGGNSGDPGTPDNNPNADNNKGPCGSSICFGERRTGPNCRHPKPERGGVSTQITADYHSRSVNPNVVIPTTFKVKTGSRVPDDAVWWFRIAGREFTGTGRDVNVVRGMARMPMAIRSRRGLIRSTRHTLDLSITANGFSQYTRSVTRRFRSTMPRSHPLVWLVERLRHSANRSGQN